MPPLGSLGAVYDRDPEEALELAFAHSQLMAMEMLALGVDLSFAPVLDVNGESQVIGADGAWPPADRDPVAISPTQPYIKQEGGPIPHAKRHGGLGPQQGCQGTRRLACP